MKCENGVSFEYLLRKSAVSTAQMGDIDLFLFVIVVIDGVECPKK